MAEAQDTNVGSYESAQSRADEALQPHGRRAPGPLLGEPAFSYRRRLCGEVQKHSPKWRDLPLSGVRSDAFEAIESQVYQDVAATPLNVPPGELRAIPKTGYGGHQITEYFGSPDVWMGPLSGPVRQYVRSFNDKAA